MDNLISIIIPVYNHAHTIERCFESIYKQSYRPLEVIIVDDGSTDDFKVVIEKIKNSEEAKVMDIKVVYQENKGAPAARNAGFILSRGKYVIFWDADTVAKPFMLQEMREALDIYKEASYAYSQFKFGWKTMKSQEFDMGDLRKNNFIDTTSLIRREALELCNFKPFDESLKRFQDWDLWLTLLQQKKSGVFIPEVLFRKIVEGRKGYKYSAWLPSFMYRLPWLKKVADYNSGKDIVLNKHHLL